MRSLKWTLGVALVATFVVATSVARAAEQSVADEIKAWTKKLSRENPENVRCDAADMLGYIGDEAALSDLAELVQEHPQTLRAHVVEALGRMGGARAIRVLMESMANRYLLQGWEWEPKRCMGEALGRIGDPATHAMVKNHADKGCQYAEAGPDDSMLFGLSWYPGEDAAIQSIVNVMKTGNPEKQYLAAERLSEFGNKKSDDELCMVLDYTKDEKLKRIAARSIGYRHVKSTAESLMDALTTGLELDASQSLGMIGAKKAAGELKPLLKNPSDAVKLNAAFALARLGDAGGVEFAKSQLAAKDPVVAAKAAATLAAAGDAAGVAKLKEAWNPLNAKQRYWFILDNLNGDAWAAPILKDVAANDKYPGIKKLAAACLKKMGM